jgi:hypothetical protein
VKYARTHRRFTATTPVNFPVGEIGRKTNRRHVRPSVNRDRTCSIAGNGHFDALFVQTSERPIARENKVQSFRATQLLDSRVSKKPIVSGRRNFSGTRSATAERAAVPQVATRRFLGEVIGIRNHPGEWNSDPNLSTVRRSRSTVNSRGISSRAAKASSANFRLVVESPLAPGEVITALLQILVTNIVR